MSGTLDIQKIIKEESNFLKLIDIIPDAIVIVDQEGEIKYVNLQTQKMFGYDAYELIGEKVEKLMPERFRQKHVDHRKTYTLKPITRLMGSGLDLRGRRKNGTEFPVDIMLSPIKTEESSLVISVIRDITERKEAEEEVKKRARQLEDIVSTLTHDLKTPLVAQERIFKNLLDGQFGKITKEQEQIFYHLIKSNSDSLRIVKNLLSACKYELKSYKLLSESVEVSGLLNKAISTIKPFLEEKKISLKLPDTNFHFVCDPFEIERVILNLLTNSIKFTPVSGNIELKAIKSEDGLVTISVEDTGKGILPEELPKIFGRFWQSRKSNDDSGSTGLGLYLCRQIIEAHGGKIWAESKHGKGTKITFQIPELRQ